VEVNAPTKFDPNKPIKAVTKPTGYYELMLSLSDLGSKEKALAQQMKLADEMRTSDMPGMRGNSRIMVAANPLEFANAGLRQGLGARDRATIMGHQAELANEIRRRIQQERDKDKVGGYAGPSLGEGGGYIPQMGE
jgi:hypothetical protein